MLWTPERRILIIIYISSQPLNMGDSKHIFVKMDIYDYLLSFAFYLEDSLTLLRLFLMEFKIKSKF